MIQKLRLPSSLDSLQSTIFTMEGPLNLIMKGVDEPTERNIIESLIHELNSKFNVGLDSNFSTSRCKDLSSLEEHMATDDYIVVGSSHAFRISSALTTLGEKVLCLASPYWRLNAENVESTAKSLEEAVRNNPGATVVFQLYDSSIFFSSLENGEPGPAKTWGGWPLPHRW